MAAQAYSSEFALAHSNDNIKPKGCRWAALIAALNKADCRTTARAAWIARSEGLTVERFVEMIQIAWGDA